MPDVFPIRSDWQDRALIAGFSGFVLIPCS
jgi:hypothetical protein